MKRNLKFLLTTIISIISLSAVATNAMQNNPNDNAGSGYKNYNLSTIFKNYEQIVKNQEQNSNSNYLKEEAERENKKRFEEINQIETQIKRDQNNGRVFQFDQSRFQEHFGLNFNLNLQQNKNLDNKKKENEKKKINRNNSTDNIRSFHSINNACKDFVLKNFENHKIKRYNRKDEYFNKKNKKKLKKQNNNNIENIKEKYKNMLKEYEKEEETSNYNKEVEVKNYNIQKYFENSAEAKKEFEKNIEELTKKKLEEIYKEIAKMIKEAKKSFEEIVEKQL